MIQVIAIVVSLIVSLISIIQTRKSIRLTEKTIKDANRPYLSLYIETLDTIYFSKYIVLKKYGTTSAKIIDLKFDTKLDRTNEKFKLSSLIGGSVAPGQKFTSVLKSDYKEMIYGTITYQGLDGTLYKENFSLKSDIHSKLLWQKKRSSKDSVESDAIKQAAQAIIKSFK